MSYRLGPGDLVRVTWSGNYYDEDVNENGVRVRDELAHQGMTRLHPFLDVSSSHQGGLVRKHGPARIRSASPNQRMWAKRKSNHTNQSGAGGCQKVDHARD